MGSAFVVQQRDGRGSTSRTVTGETTYAGAIGLADELRRVLDDLRHLPAPPVRVIGTDQVDDEATISRARGRDAAALAAEGLGPALKLRRRGAVLHFPSTEATRRPPDAPPSYQKVRAATPWPVTRRG